VWLEDRNTSSGGPTPSETARAETARAETARAETDPSDAPHPTPEGSLPSSPRAPVPDPDLDLEPAPDPPLATHDHASPRPTPSDPSSPHALPDPSASPISRTPDPVARKTEPRFPPREPGRLQVNVLPWAEVSVDGRSLGRVPVDVELAPGRHRVRLSNPQLGERTLEVEVPAGGVHTISRW
jgi:hypothetical protein